MMMTRGISCLLLSVIVVSAQYDTRCGVPQDPENATLVRVNGNQHSWGLYERVSTTCRDGFLSLGSNWMMCVEGGLWLDVSFCRYPIRCGIPQAPANGTLVGVNTTQLSWEPDERVSIACNSGFRPIGSPWVSCQANGQWSDAPICQYISGCGIPQAPENGRLVGVNPNQQSWDLGERVSITCNRGYQRIGLSWISCGVNGQWSSTTCRYISGCGIPQAPANGYLIGVNPNQQSWTTYARISARCHSGCISSGARWMYCQRNGQWSGAQTCWRCPGK